MVRRSLPIIEEQLTDASEARSSPEYWRSVAEALGEDPESSAGELPPGAGLPPDAVSRRSFLTYAGASMALAGLSACQTRPSQSALPYSRQPPEVTPGIPLSFATAMTIGGYATGLLVESSEGRPTKIEGNPEHPASLGASSAQHQASLLGLYDPHRAAALRELDTPRSWRDLAATLARPAGDTGRGTSFLLEPTGSPTVERLLTRIRPRYPDAKVYFYSPLEPSSERAGSRAAFGRVLETQLRPEIADVIVALDSDFLCSGPFALRHARAFAERRRVIEPRTEMNRLYVAEAHPSPTGTLADHRLALRHREVLALLAAIVSEVFAAQGPAGGAVVDLSPSLRSALDRLGKSNAHADFARAAARDLAARRGAGLVVVGDRQPAEVHALAHFLNRALGNTGETLVMTPSPILEAGEPSHDLRNLVYEIKAGRVERLLVLGGNPAYTAPRDLELAQQLRAVQQTIYLGPYDNETAAACRWYIPEAHYLESWGDARALDGTISFVQPLIEPLYAGKTVAEVLSLCLGETDGMKNALLRSWVGPEAVRAGRAPISLREQVGRGAGEAPAAAETESGVAPPETPPSWLDTRLFERTFAAALRMGLVEGSTFQPVDSTPLLDLESIAASVEAAAVRAQREPPAELELGFLPDRRVLDGSFTNIPWLLELPEPLTKQVWGNSVILDPRTAKRIGIEDGDAVELTVTGRSLIGPALILPGQAPGAITVWLGWGRRGAEANARGVGFDAYALRTTEEPSYTGRVVLEKVSPGRLKDNLDPVRTQSHFSVEGRPLALMGTLAEFRADPRRWRPLAEPTPSVRAAWPAEGPQWAMSIDLGACMGCSACVIACQAENNVPVVGKLNVSKSREMHWLRVDRYFAGSIESPEILMQPMFCQHCERAPCEYVCPVNATVHSEDGLNDMVYNRCVGTRFCSNNCPYKVRRFNWFDFHKAKSPVEILAMNPDVTVRARGVMEKCTYCVQRIRRAGIDARIEGRPIKDGELMTACEQACPTRAIVFGDIQDPNSRVRLLRDSGRAYEALHDVGARPRTRYLVKLQNPNPDLGERKPG